MILSALQLVARRTFAHFELLVAVAIGVLLATTILSGSVIYTNSLKDLAVQHALAPSDEEDVDLLITATFGPLAPDSRGLVRSAVEDRIGPAVAEFGTLTGFTVKSETFLISSNVGVGDGQNEPTSNDNRRMWFAEGSSFEPHIRYVAGGSPGPLASSQDLENPDAPVTWEVAISAGDARNLRVGVGDSFAAFPAWISVRERVNVVISGIYERSDADAEIWRLYDEGLQDPSVLRRTVGLLVEDAAFLELASTALPQMQAKFGWFYDMRTEGLTPSEGRDLVDRLDSADRFLSGTLDNYFQTTDLDSLIGSVTESVTFNTVPMTVVLILVVIVVLYYVAVLGLLLVETQRTEIGLLTSRGATALQVLAVYVIEIALLALAAAIVAPFIALGAVSLIGVLPWFSELNDGALLPVRLTAGAFQMTAIGGLLIMLSLFIPALSAARIGLVHQLRSMARPPALNFMQRYYLDLVFVAIVVYLFWLLSQQGSFVGNRLFGEDKVDELILAAPALMLVAIAIVVVRLFPIATALLAMALSSPKAHRIAPATMVLGLWEMARNPAHHARFSLLLMLTAGLGVFAASFGATLERSFEERVLYESGADVRLTGMLRESGGPSSSIVGVARGLDGVEASSAAFRTLAAVLDLRKINEFDLLAVDLQTIGNVAWIRDDFEAARNPGLLSQISAEAAGGLVLPQDAASLNIRFRPSLIPSGITVISARVEDANARFFNLELGFLAGGGLTGIPRNSLALENRQVCLFDADGWCELSAELEQIRLIDGELFLPAFPLEVHAIGISRSARLRFGGTFQPAAMDLDTLSVTDRAGNVTVVESFDNVSRWHALRTSPGSRGDLLRMADDDGVPVPGIARFVWTRASVAEFRGIGFGPEPAPVPVLISETFLDEFKLELGDQVRIGSGRWSLDVVFADTIDFFPTLDPQRRPFMIADLSNLIRRTNFSQIGSEVHPDEVWITTPTNAQQLADELPIRFFQIVERSELLGRVEIDPLLSAGWRALLAVSFFTVLMVSAIGLLVHSRVTFQSRSRDFALLRTVGLSMRQLLGLVVLEHALVIGVAITVGAVAGARLGSTIMPYLVNSGEGVDVVPPMILQIDWSSFATAFGLLGGVLAVVIAIVLYAVYKMSIHSAMRLGD
ncbi:MAG: ABC transporter permease [Chloroflexi bacterium]|nr:ABC transporter permease [Chloroflexota bacterium]